MTSSDLSRELHMHTTQFPTPITHLWVCLADVSNLTCPPPHPCFRTSDLSPSTCIFPISKEYHYPPIISIRKLEILVLSYFSLNPLPFLFSKGKSFPPPTSNPSIPGVLHCSHLTQVHYHPFDELLKPMPNYFHSCTLQSILHKWARTNVLKWHCIVCIMELCIMCTLVHNVPLIQMLQDLPLSSRSPRAALVVTEFHPAWGPCTHTFLCLECSSRSSFLLTLQVQLKCSILIIPPF